MDPHSGQLTLYTCVIKKTGTDYIVIIMDYSYTYSATIIIYRTRKATTTAWHFEQVRIIHYHYQ